MNPFAKLDLPEAAGSAGTAAQVMPQSVSVGDFVLPPPPREWILDGRIPMREVTLLSGEGGKGKSLLALMLSVAVAAEVDWLGMPMKKTGGVLYVGAEDELDEIHRRLIDITRHHGITLQDLTGLRVVPASDMDAALVRETSATGPLEPTPFYEHIRQEIDTYRPSLVVLDTAADLYPANENDRAKVRHFISLLKRWGRNYNCAVVLLSHPSRAGIATGSGDSGSTAWHGSVRARIYMTGDKDGRSIQFKKANYGPDDGQTINMKWVEGCFVATDGAEDGPQLIEAQIVALAERIKRYWQDVDIASYPRKDVQAPGWVGHDVADVLGWDSGRDIKKGDLTEVQREVRERIKQYVAGLMMAGILHAETIRDTKKGRDVVCIRCSR